MAVKRPRRYEWLRMDSRHYRCYRDSVLVGFARGHGFGWDGYVLTGRKWPESERHVTLSRHRLGSRTEEGYLRNVRRAVEEELDSMEQSTTDPLGLGLRATRRQLEILRRMRDTGEEIVYSQGTGYVGLERFSRSVMTGLLRLAAVRADSMNRTGGGRGDAERYSLNETGRAILEAANV